MSEVVRETEHLAGGCQCGAIRYVLHESPRHPHICHCRMCQKAFGSFFAPLTVLRRERFEVTRGKFAVFASSDATDRGFCRDCGTPLTFAYRTSKFIAVSIGSLDDPSAVEPTIQYGIESRVSYFAALAGLPGEKTADDEEGRLDLIRATNHQHPDHDTAVWPPAETKRAGTKEPEQ